MGGRRSSPLGLINQVYDAWGHGWIISSSARASILCNICLRFPNLNALTFNANGPRIEGKLQFDPTPPLGMVNATQTRHVLLASFVDVHVTG